MTVLVEPVGAPTRTATLRVLAGVEACRYARHPLFLIGAGVLVFSLFMSRDDLVVTSIGEIDIAPAFYLGLLGVFVGFRLTRSMTPSTEAVHAAPIDGVIRTAALCLACLVPGVVAVVCFCWLYAGPIPESVALSSADRAAILFEGVVCAVGGPLVGVMVGRWTRFPGAGLVAVAVLVGWSVLGTLSEAMSATRLSTLARLNVPFTTWVGGPIDNHPWVPGGSPEWYLAYLTLLCGLAATAAMLHEASGAQRTSLERALIVLAVLAVATLALAAAGDPTRIPL